VQQGRDDGEVLTGVRIVEARQVKKCTHQLRLQEFGVLVGVFRCFHDLERNLNHTSGKVSNGDELSKGGLQDALQLSLGSTFTRPENLATRRKNDAV
jgi:hypothetical protein